MSALALSWAYSRPISNPTEKNVLAFLASHNFGGNQSCFKVKTICAATAYKESSVREALKQLAKKEYIIKTAKYGEDGRQIPNECTINIPQDYINEFYSKYEKSMVPEESVDKSGGAPPPAGPPPSTQWTP